MFALLFGDLRRFAQTNGLGSTIVLHGGLMKHAVIVCTRNRPSELRSLISMVDRVIPVDTQIIVVDASDNDLRLDLIDTVSLRRSVTLIHSGPGLTHQRNIGLKAIQRPCDIVHFLDDDVEIPDDYLCCLDSVYQELPAAVGVGVRTTDNSDYIPSRWRRLFLLDSLLSGRVLCSGVNVGFKKPSGTYEVDWLPGCTMSFRLEAIEGLKFDESRLGVGWGEDVDFSLKAAARGPLYVTASAQVLHRRSPRNRDSDEIRDRETLKHRMRLARDFPHRVNVPSIMWSVMGEHIIRAGQEWRAHSHSVVSAFVSLVRSLYYFLRSVLVWLFSMLRLLVAPMLGIADFFSRRRLVKIPSEGPDLGRVNPPSSIAIALQGGLGNQLFGLAAGLGQAKRLDTDLLLDISNFDDRNPRAFELSWALGEGIGLSRRARFRHALREASFAYDAAIAATRPDTLLEGYFQSWRYFDDIADDVRKIIFTRAKSHGYEIPSRPAKFIGLQVRRGDYVEPKAQLFHGLCTLDYYARGVNICRQLVGALPVRVFSDDYSAAVETASALVDATVDEPLPGKDSQDSLSTLFRLSSASALVISNSSFGWWAGWLADPGVPVIAPRPWFTDRTLDTTDLLPAEWLTIDRIG